MGYPWLEIQKPVARLARMSFKRDTSLDIGPHFSLVISFLATYLVKAATYSISSVSYTVFLRLNVKLPRVKANLAPLHPAPIIRGQGQRAQEEQ